MDKNKLYCIAVEMSELMGEKQLLNALVRAMRSDELESYLRFIDKSYETQVFNQSEDE